MDPIIFMAYLIGNPTFLVDCDLKYIYFNSLDSDIISIDSIRRKTFALIFNGKEFNVIELHGDSAHS